MADSDDITDLVQEFMAVTGAEDVTAMRYLQQSNWNVEVSVLQHNIFPGFAQSCQLEVFIQTAKQYTYRVLNS